MPAGPGRLGRIVSRVTPLGLPGSVSWQRLSSFSVPHGHLTHATPWQSVLRVPLKPQWRRGKAGTPSQEVGTQTHRCLPLAHQVLLKGGVWPAGHGVVVRRPIPNPRTSPVPNDTTPICGWVHPPLRNPLLGKPDGAGCPGTLTELVVVPTPVGGMQLGPEMRACARWPMANLASSKPHDCHGAPRSCTIPCQSLAGWPTHKPGGRNMQATGKSGPKAGSHNCPSGP